MDGLLDFLRTPGGQGLLAGVAGYASGARRGTPVNNIGRGLLGGLAGYGAAEDRVAEQAQLAKRNELWDAQLANYRTEAEAKAAALAREKAKMAALPSLFAGSVTPGSVSVPEVGGVDFFSQGAKVDAPSMRTGAGQLDWQRALAAGYKPEEITALAGLQDIGRPKATRQLEVDDGKGGKRLALVDDFGREVAGFSGYTAPVQVNRGDRVDFVKPAPGVSLGVNMSPAERDASARGWASNSLARERLDFDRRGGAEATKAPAGYRWTPDGNLQAIQGGPADKATTATEGERKAATLLTRMDGSLQQLQKVTEANKSAAKPEVIPSVVRAVTWGNETAGNIATSSDRQRVEAAQLDILDAALTLGTGAAYTREQLEGYRKSYFPQMGDSQDTISDKKKRLENVLQAARIAAGRAAPASAGGSQIDSLVQKYGGR